MPVSRLMREYPDATSQGAALEHQAGQVDFWMSMCQISPEDVPMNMVGMGLCCLCESGFEDHAVVWCQFL